MGERSFKALEEQLVQRRVILNSKLIDTSREEEQLRRVGRKASREERDAWP